MAKTENQNLTALEIDGETGESKIRELNDAELAQRELDLQVEIDAKAELEAREQLRQSAISKLVAGQPLTTAEAELLVIR